MFNLIDHYIFYSFELNYKYNLNMIISNHIKLVKHNKWFETNLTGNEIDIMHTPIRIQTNDNYIEYNVITYYNNHLYFYVYSVNKYKNNGRFLCSTDLNILVNNEILNTVLQFISIGAGYKRIILLFNNGRFNNCKDLLNEYHLIETN